MSHDIGTQLKQLYAPLMDIERKQLEVEIVECPKQPYSSDCEMYSAAVAVEWANRETGKLPIDWDVPAMREHLVACLEKAEITPFPRVLPYAHPCVPRNERPRRAAPSNKMWV